MTDVELTTKQMGDACEMLVAAELTLRGIPTLKVPDNWPHYDLIAQPPGGDPLRISVKSRNFRKGAHYLRYDQSDKFDWLGIVIIGPDSKAQRRIYLVPNSIADERTRAYERGAAHPFREQNVDRIDRIFPEFESNFGLNKTGLTEEERRSL
jgi:hypothetical protein